jgi:hypothetical protein
MLDVVEDHRIKAHNILLMHSRRDLSAVASTGLVRPKTRMRSMQAPLSAVLALAILKKRNTQSSESRIRLRKQIQKTGLGDRVTIAPSSPDHRIIIDPPSLLYLGLGLLSISRAYPA